MGRSAKGKGERAKRPLIADCGFRIAECKSGRQEAVRINFELRNGRAEGGSRQNAVWKFVSDSPEGFICRERLLALFALFLATFCLSEHPCGARVCALSSSSPSSPF